MEGRSQGAHNEVATRRHPVKKLDGLVSTAARHAGDDDQCVRGRRA
jgi:hypothetical protein